MNKQITFSIIGGVILVGAIFLQLFCKIKNVEFLSLGGILISVLFGIYALIESASSKKQFDKQLDEFKTIEQNFKTTEQNLKIIEQNLKTRHINTFPENFVDIDNLFELCLGLKKTNEKIKLEIFTDYVGYGSFSKNSAFIDYEKKIENLWRNKKIQVTWNFYDEKHKDLALAKQFNTYDAEAIEKYIIKSKENLKEPCDDTNCPVPNNSKCENCERKIIMGLNEKNTTKDELVEAIKSVLKIKEDNLKNIKSFANLEAKPNNSEFNYFGWFVFANKELKRTIISYPNYGLSNESGLVTESHELMKTLRSVILNNAISTQCAHSNERIGSDQNKNVHSESFFEDAVINTK